MAHLAALTLVPATREQVILSRKRHCTEWGKGLSEAQYLAREEQFEKLEHAKDGKLTIWVLVPRDDTGTLNFLCSCETFRRRALVRKPTSSLPEEITAYGIASVFCPPENRKRGFASHMMRLLHHVLSKWPLSPVPPEWGTPPVRYPDVGGDAEFSVLYSDVGDFYKHCGPSPQSPGWDIRSPFSTMWDTSLVTEANKDNAANLLTEEQCRDLWEADAQYIKDTLLHLPPSSRTRFTFLPNNGTAAFLVLRAKDFLTNPELLPEHWGISFPLQDGAQTAYATWTLDTNPGLPPVLLITRLRSTPEAFPALVQALLAVARGVGARAVEAWNLDPSLQKITERIGGKTILRGDHLPAVAWYGAHNLDEVEWVFNEKFPWC